MNDFRDVFGDISWGIFNDYLCREEEIFNDIIGGKLYSFYIDLFCIGEEEFAYCCVECWLAKYSLSRV